MSYKIMYFRNAEQILKEKKMVKEVKLVMEYLHECLYGTGYKGELLRQALTEMDWRPTGDLNILDGRRYFYKGFKNRVALDGSFTSYEYIQDALLRLQVGYDKKKIDLGIVMITAQRSEKSKLGSTEELVSQEIEMLHPTINLPVTIVLFDLGKPGELYEENRQKQEKAKQPDNPVNDQKLIDKYLHGDSANQKEPEKAGTEAKTSSKAQGKKKSASKTKKEALPEQQAA